VSTETGQLQDDAAERAAKEAKERLEKATEKLAGGLGGLLLKESSDLERRVGASLAAEAALIGLSEGEPLVGGDTLKFPGIPFPKVRRGRCELGGSFRLWVQPFPQTGGGPRVGGKLKVKLEVEIAKKVKVEASGSVEGSSDEGVSEGKVEIKVKIGG